MNFMERGNPFHTASRSLHASTQERMVLLTLLQKHLTTLEIKDTDSRTLSKRAELWEQVAKDFNTATNVHRNKGQIQTLYKNMKAKARKYQCRMHESSLENTLSPEPDEVSETLMHMLGSQAKQTRSTQLYQSALIAAALTVNPRAAQLLGNDNPVSSNSEQISNSSNDVTQFLKQELLEADGNPSSPEPTSPTNSLEQNIKSTIVDSFQEKLSSYINKELNLSDTANRNDVISQNITPISLTSDADTEIFSSTKHEIVNLDEMTRLQNLLNNPRENDSRNNSNIFPTNDQTTNGLTSRDSSNSLPDRSLQTLKRNGSPIISPLPFKRTKCSSSVSDVLRNGISNIQAHPEYVAEFEKLINSQKSNSPLKKDTLLPKSLTNRPCCSDSHEQILSFTKIKHTMEMKILDDVYELQRKKHEHYILEHEMHRKEHELRIAILQFQKEKLLSEAQTDSEE